MKASQVPIGVGYTTRQYRLPPDALGSDLVVISAPTPLRPRGGGLSVVEGDRCLVTLIGVLDDRPPTDPAGFTDFAADLALPDVARLLLDAQPLDDPVAFRHPASRWNHFEKMARFPTGLLVLGDAVCNLTPIYGQGMTVAALQAAALSQQLAQSQHPRLHGLQRQVARIAGQAWALATGADLAFPQVPGHRGPTTRFLGRYVARVQAAAAHDPTVGRAFLRVTSLVDPPQALFRPSILARAAGPLRVRDR